MAKKKMLPVGVDNFEKLIQQDFYYVDKTGIISELLHNWGEVNLFTRPGRFGKSLNMNMLKCFFEIGCDESVFEGLKISEETELCKKYMGQFPVISISLKSVEGRDFQSAKEAMKCMIGDEALRFQFLLESKKLSENEKEQFRQLIQPAKDDQGVYGMSDTMMMSSLQRLSSLLARHYGKKVIILIDEYDVPLDKAFQNNYYDEMVFIVIEMKYADNGDMDVACAQAIRQIEELHYDTKLKDDGMHTIIKYGIACYKKDCKVVTR